MLMGGHHLDPSIPEAWPSLNHASAVGKPSAAEDILTTSGRPQHHRQRFPGHGPVW